MDLHWTNENLEEDYRTLLGCELASAAELFPRIVSATYIQMMTTTKAQGTFPDAEEFRAAIRRSMPASLPEALPFFVRSVWNRKWDFADHEHEILSLAALYVALLNNNSDTRLTAEELVSECKSSFAYWHD